MKYSQDVLDYVLKCKDELGCNFDTIANQLHTTRETIYCLYTHETSLRNGSLTIVRSPDSVDSAPKITLQEMLDGNVNSGKVHISIQPKLKEQNFLANETSYVSDINNLKTRNSSERLDTTEAIKLAEARLSEKIIYTDKNSSMGVPTEESNGEDESKTNYKRTKFGEKDKNYVIEQYTKYAASIKDIAVDMEISATSVRELLGDTEKRHIRRKMSSQDKEEILKRLANGSDKCEIAYEFGYSRGMIEKVLKILEDEVQADIKPKEADVKSKEADVKSKEADVQTKEKLDLNPKETDAILNETVTEYEKEAIEEQDPKNTLEDTINGTDTEEKLTILRVGGVPEEVKQAIIKAYVEDEQCTITQLTLTFGRHRNTIKRILSNAGVLRRYTHNKGPEKPGIHGPHKLQMYKLKTDGVPLEIIAEQYPQYDHDVLMKFLNSELNEAWRVRLENMLQKKYPFTRLSDDKCEQIRIFRLENMPPEDMAIKLDTTVPTVQKVLKYFGLEYPSIVVTRIKPIYDKEEVEQLYRTGYSLRSIANKLGIPISIVRQHVQSLGILRPSNGGSSKTNVNENSVELLKKDIEELKVQLAENTELLRQILSMYSKNANCSGV